jgi:hypothetical protein
MAQHHPGLENDHHASSSQASSVRLGTTRYDDLAVLPGSAIHTVEGDLPAFACALVR